MWYHPCEEIVNQYNNEYTTSIDYKLIHLDVDQCVELCEKYKINQLPTIMFF